MLWNLPFEKQQHTLWPVVVKKYSAWFTSPSLFWQTSHYAWITWVSGSPCAHTVVFSTCCAQCSLVATVVMGASLGWHGLILRFRSPGGTVAGEDEQFCFALSDYFQGCLHPSMHFPLVITSWSLVLVNSSNFVIFSCGHHLSTLGVGRPPTKSSRQTGWEREK